MTAIDGHRMATAAINRHTGDAGRLAEAWAGDARAVERHALLLLDILRACARAESIGRRVGVRVRARVALLARCLHCL